MCKHKVDFYTCYKANERPPKKEKKKKKNLSIQKRMKNWKNCLSHWKFKRKKKKKGFFSWKIKKESAFHQ